MIIELKRYLELYVSCSGYAFFIPKDIIKSSRVTPLFGDVTRSSTGNHARCFMRLFIDVPAIQPTPYRYQASIYAHESSQIQEFSVFFWDFQFWDMTCSKFDADHFQRWMDVWHVIFIILEIFFVKDFHVIFDIFIFEKWHFQNSMLIISSVKCMSETLFS